MTPQRLTDAELKEALELAGKATPGKWEACPEKEYIFCNGDMIAEVRGIGAFLNTERNCEHIATMNPEFASRLLKEVIWARGMLNVGHEIITNRDLPDDTWLSDYERGPE